MSDDYAILKATTVNCRTLADDTLRVSFDFMPKDATTAFGLFGQRGVLAAIALLKNDIEMKNDLEIEENKYGKLATHLYANGFFYNPKVLEAIGSDEQFRHWIQKKPSAYSGKYSEYVEGEGRCIAAHVRRANNSGTSIKPPYACIPLTNDEHMLQHREGESALNPPEWFDKKRNEYVIAWAKETLLSQLGDYAGFREVPPRVLRNWANKYDLTRYLPLEYKA